jgi:hypothetical protein
MAHIKQSGKKIELSRKVETWLEEFVNEKFTSGNSPLLKKSNSADTKKALLMSRKMENLEFAKKKVMTKLQNISDVLIRKRYLSCRSSKVNKYKEKCDKKVMFV